MRRGASGLVGKRSRHGRAAIVSVFLRRSMEHSSRGGRRYAYLLVKIGWMLLPRDAGSAVSADLLLQRKGSIDEQSRDYRR